MRGMFQKDEQPSAKGKLLFVVVNGLNRDAAFVLVFINGVSCGFFFEESRGFNFVVENERIYRWHCGPTNEDIIFQGSDLILQGTN